MKTWTDEATAHVKRYLRRVQVLLENAGADAHEVTEDLSRHIHQRANDSPHVVITIDEANRILATMGSPDEVALSWKQLGTEPEKDSWDSPALNPPPPQPTFVQRWAWAIIGLVVVIGLLAIVVGPVVGYLSVGSHVSTTNEATQRTPLFQAASNGHLETVQSLLDKGTSIDAQDAQGMTALHHAAKNGHNGIAQLLVQRGANVEIRDNAEKTAADYAAAGGHQETLEAITGNSTPIHTHEEVLQPLEKPKNWLPGWFQAGSNHTDYSTGTASRVDGIIEAMFIRGAQPNAAGFSTVMTQVPADSFRGKRVRLNGKIKTDIANGSAAMWMRIDAADGSAVGFDNMSDRLITGATPMTTYAIELDVPENSVNIAYGILFQGEGAVYFGNVELR